MIVMGADFRSDLPKSIQIGAYKVDISIDPDYMEKASAEHGASLAGISEFDKQSITIGEYPHDYTADTLLHEILHMCLRVASCNIDDEIETNNVNDVEERVISAITNILLDTLRRNPRLAAYLLSSK